MIRLCVYLCCSICYAILISSCAENFKPSTEKENSLSGAPNTSVIKIDLLFKNEKAQVNTTPSEHSIQNNSKVILDNNFIVVEKNINSEN